MLCDGNVRTGCHTVRICRMSRSMYGTVVLHAFDSGVHVRTLVVMYDVCLIAVSDFWIRGRQRVTFSVGWHAYVFCWCTGY